MQPFQHDCEETGRNFSNIVRETTGFKKSERLLEIKYQKEKLQLSLPSDLFTPTLDNLLLQH